MSSIEKSDLGFVFFRTTDLYHLDAAWFTLARQNFTHVERVIFINNNTQFDTLEIEHVLSRYRLPVRLDIHHELHRDSKKTHSWSVNRFIELSSTPWIFFARSDYLLNYDLLTEFWKEKERRQQLNPTWRGLITSYCHQMGYDSGLSNTDALAPYSLPGAEWRMMLEGPKFLFGKVPANYFESSGVDAGVFLTQRMNFTEIGGMNENLVNWGFNQQEAQGLMQGRGVEMVALKEYLYHHQHHYAPRDFQVANSEHEQFARK